MAVFGVRYDQHAVHRTRPSADLGLGDGGATVVDASAGDPEAMVVLR